ncbi:DNA polymerase zeta catalytic subunit-like [Dorcoceras hygrometricum]|uniref:DNA polymerase n=1 Tax=Dorcoceras hygrometricum TaxID=472368 RepID=A0A2Z7CK51_9LAMI|nr:DNA polymerase zeta catalytic subunit-like [Dorcoceras hygrometricum]
MEDSKVFSVRIVSIDYYMSAPIPGVDISQSTFHGGKVKEVPVIRIFGPTPAGQKTCLHIHRALPYLYIPWSDLGHIPDDEVDSCMHALSLDLDKALKLKGNAGSKRQHVHCCNLVRARKFYGYHPTEDLFVKIYLYATENLDEYLSYYPQDVSRAAKLLLAGGVMDKILQPYEAHIPFLLQFLIDNNLYGMGHLHVSKIKFRHPVPDVFPQPKSNCTRELGSLSEDSTSMVGNSQADIGDGTCSNFPLWTSSTVPDCQIMKNHCQTDPSANEDIPFFKRQSTTELEGDAVIDEIINQQFLSYARLSQAHSDVKMVQSLIPIWEEEVERTGVPEVMLPNSEKPLPQDVLKTLSYGIDSEMSMEVNDNEGRETPLSPSSIKCSTDCINLVDYGLNNFDGSSNLSSKQLNKSDNNGSSSLLDSSAEAVYENKTVASDTIDKLRFSCSMGQLNEKTSDDDALRLLKWLASSQAAEDINSDDELAHESILSPLVPVKTIDKALEKANVEYESESQQECQDILDSVDMLNFEELNGRASDLINNSHSSQSVSNKIIPQVDGSNDDLQSTSLFNESHKSDTNEQNSPEEVKPLPEIVSRSCEHYKKRPRWGSLPVSSQNTSNVSFPKTLNTFGGCDGKNVEGFDTAERFPFVIKVDEKKDDGCTEQASGITTCSTRELMRKKRSNRTEQSELRSPIQDQNIFCQPMHRSPVAIEGSKYDGLSMQYADKISSEVKPVKRSTFGNLPLCCRTSIEPGNTPNLGNQEAVIQLDNDFNIFCEHMKNSQKCDRSQPPYKGSNIDGQDSSCLDLLQTNTICSDAVADLAASDCVSKNECDDHLIAKHKVPSPVEDSNDMTSKTTITPCGNSPYQESKPGFAMPNYLISGNVNEKAESVKLVSMVFSEKPPTMECSEEPGGGAPGPRVRHGNQVMTVQDRSVEDCLPFFVKDFPEEKELPPKNYDYINQHESVMGVPILYQNDGSHLFLLTSAISPPSTECVDKWLISYGSDVMSQNSDARSLFPLSSDGSSGDVFGSPGSQADTSNSPPRISVSLSREKSNLDQVHEHNQVSCNMKVKESQKKPEPDSRQDPSQISGPDRTTKLTPLSQIGFRDPASVGGGQQLTLLSVEIHAESRGDLRPDPRFDAINVIVLVFQEDDDFTLDVHVLLRSDHASVVKDLNAIFRCKVVVFSEELQLFSHFSKLIHSADPDVIMGWDVQSGSLGFLAERAGYLGLGLLNNISRTPSETNEAVSEFETSKIYMVKEMLSESEAGEVVHLKNMLIEDEWGRTHASGVHVGGRIVLNIWRLMRNEVKLNIYTAEAVAESVLRRKIPYIHWKVLTKWFSSGPGRARYRSVDYILERAKLNLQIMNQLDVINRTSELARVFGIDFFSVLSRGSQYRVESMFLRLAHTQNYLAISPGNQQVANQPAMECLPLVMEPESSFYADPVIVLDFQSLYPSMVIAYNLCFCTCLGKIAPPQENCLGVSSYSADKHTLHNLRRELLLTPNGVLYVSSKLRKGILPRLLEEILSTRIMVKQAMKKLAPSQKVLARIFNSRQLALKLIANVTYGYTAAGFSGRMPCAELADSIVQCGRRTLETAISFVNSNEKWKARVVYGDTDSMFVLLKGRSLKEAFTIGREIASAVTEMNPNPVTLKMEKVYYPCFLLTKKRYVGYSYESPDQSNPTFDAKGIETVRRDTCAAVSKTMEQSLRIYFEYQNINEVQSYLQRQWTRILSGRVSLQDFVFAKEVRLGTYSARASSLPPAAIVATKAMKVDPRAEPRYAERIPYVVVHAEPGARLLDMVVDPLEVLDMNSPYRLNDIYYIRKQIIPALQRVFGLLGADLSQWFLDMPRPSREPIGKRHSLGLNPLRKRIDYYYTSRHCFVCGDLVHTSSYLCSKCLENEATAAIALIGRTSKLEKDIQHLTAICRHCGGGDWLVESGVKCISLACSVFYERRKVQKELQSLSEVARRAGFYPKCMVEWF